MEVQGDHSVCASLTIVQDTKVEKDEVFSLTVESPDFAFNVVGGPMRIVIQDDDSELIVRPIREHLPLKCIKFLVLPLVRVLSCPM